MNVVTKKLITFMHTLLFLVILWILLVSGTIGDDVVRCLEKERLVLLKVKDDLIDDYGILSTWGPEEAKKDCCKWNGVRCDNASNHVVALDLFGPKGRHTYFHHLAGKISPSLVELEYLNHLDLSTNDFNETSIPEFFGSLAKLKFLNLANSNFRGLISHHLGKLSMLQHLDLSENWLLNITDLDWLCNLRSLEYLDLGGLDLSTVTTWMQTISKLRTLKSLHMPDCTFSSVLPTSLPFINSSTSLSVIDFSCCSLNTISILVWFLNMSSSFSYIDFSHNAMKGKIPVALGNLESLSHVDLSVNMLEGGIPDTLGNLTSFLYVDLSNNMLEERIPSGLWNSTMFKYLDLSENLLCGSLPHTLRLPHLEALLLSENRFVGSVPDLASCTSLALVRLQGNRFNGTLAKSIGSLSKLEVLNLGSNNLEGIINEAHFSNYSDQFYDLDLSLNSNLRVEISSHWKPPFKIIFISLTFCKLGPEFPYWLLNACGQSASLDISNTQISDTIDKKIWDNSICFWYLNMSNNQIYGIAPDLSCETFRYVDLSSNEFDTLPLLAPSLNFVNLARNKLSRRLTRICAASFVVVLDISDNRLSGDLPHCLKNLTYIEYFNVANNNFSGRISESLGYMSVLSSLHIRNNSFRGEIPTSLRKCRWLHVLDLGENNLTGHVPAWIGGSLPMLAVLSLRSNDFYGSLPLTLCHLRNLQLLDLSLNKISGTIPKCMNNFSSMSLNPDVNQIPDNISYVFPSGFVGELFYDSITLVWKEKEVEYVRNLILLKVVDLSSNKLVGHIPHEISNLNGLFALNLSRNNLTGSIPQDIGQLKILNSLDLSENNLSGEIPDTLSQLSHLGVLNLSFNNLSGKIPWNNQIQTFDSSSYTGNPLLCGPPLPKHCPGDENPISTENVDGMDHGELISTGFYVAMALGFIVGFWGVFGTLALKKSWRLMYFKMVVNVNDWVHARIAVNWNHMRRYFEN
ncbi:LOW QUALITY PROTEIN: receptor-like protein EIX2 [Primulina tabacum]|uniref:LOW QUALITY PROTEIN: receptor-like protein EIX2 n=1 Tax=Primulina tabacum TaxID=48773 RepID=UPI003F5A0A7D